MAGHGGSRHLKRLAKPRSVPIPKKGALWIAKPSAGPHPAQESIPLIVLVRDVLKLADTAREAKKVVHSGSFVVDGRARKHEDYPVGLMDIVQIPKAGKSYQVFKVGERLLPVEIPAEDAKVKTCRIVNKTVVGGNKVQLNLHDGKNMLIEKEEDRFRVGDSVSVTIPEYKIDHFNKLEKGATCYVFRGKHAGKVALLEEVMEMPRGIPADAKLKKDGEEIITRKEYLIPVSKEFKAQ